MHQLFRFWFRSVPIAAAALTALSSEPAKACGGLFCSTASPVNQTAERIIFAQEGTRTTAVIEIQYEGPSERFAWVLPVPGVPEIGVSSKQALDRLQQLSNPQYTLNTTFEQCEFDPAPGDGDFAGGSQDAGAVFGDGDAQEPSVSVVASGSVGPYDFNVISVSDNAENPAELALEWLADNGYDVSLLGEDILASYLDEGLNLAAFRLSKNSDSGSIRPVLISYQSTQPVIPIRPTAVAADPNMGILVWVLGPGRAIPTNYRSLVLNDALINWFNPSLNYNEVVIEAADEAGGHGFVTELATGGPTTGSPYSEVILSNDDQRARVALDNLGVQNLLLRASDSFGAWDGFAEVLEQAVPRRPGYTVEEFLNCVDCYFENAQPEILQSDAGPLLTPTDAGDASSDAGSNMPISNPQADPIWSTDPAEFLELLDTLVVQPVADTAALFPGNSVTRLYTTLSADEMTDDPTFDFNPLLPVVSNIHTAEQYLYCDGSWVITLPSDLTIRGAGRTWPVSTDDGLPYNLQVVQDYTDGPSDVITDNLEQISNALGALGVLAEPVVVGPADAGAEITYVNDNGCGCRMVGSTTGATPWWMIALGSGLLLRRRRHAKQGGSQ